MGEDLKLWYEKHDITYERNLLYFNFFSVLFSKINETYLGVDVLNEQNDIYGHFCWCYNNTIEYFSTKNIVFNKNGPLHDYLWFFYYSSYYKNVNNENSVLIYEFFKSLFDFERNKSESEKDTYKFLYKLFNIAYIN